MVKGLPLILSAHSVPVLSSTLLKSDWFALATAPNEAAKVDLKKEILREAQLQIMHDTNN